MPRSWSSGRRAIGRWPDFASPFCAGALLVDPDDRAVDDGVLEIGITRQATEDPLEYTLHRPSAEALEDRIPVPERLMQIAPWRSRTRNPKYRLNKQSVVGARAPRVAGLTRKQRRNPRPLLVAQNTSIQAWSPFSNLESDFAPERNPSRAAECQHALAGSPATPKDRARASLLHRSPAEYAGV